MGIIHVLLKPSLLLKTCLKFHHLALENRCNWPYLCNWPYFLTRTVLSHTLTTFITTVIQIQVSFVNTSKLGIGRLSNLSKVTWQLNGHEFEQTPGGSEGQGSLASCTALQRVGHNLATEQQQSNNNRATYAGTARGPVAATGIWGRHPSMLCSHKNHPSCVSMFFLTPKWGYFHSFSKNYPSYLGIFVYENYSQQKKMSYMSFI